MAVDKGALGSDIRWLAGQQYSSPWFTVDQPLIDAFATVTGDLQYIHVDPDQAARTPFGGTIAHGFLLLSLLPRLHAESGRPDIPALAMAINYGFDRIRFVSPVRAGRRVRAHFTVVAMVEKSPGEWQQELDVTMEADGSERPVLALRWIIRLAFAAKAAV